MRIDYTKFDSKTANRVRIIEEKPHAKYIRYLLVKRYAPYYIKDELFKAGFSAPNLDVIGAYYMAVIDPAIKYFKLEPYYKKLKDNITKVDKASGKPSSAIPVLSFKIDFEDKKEDQVKFLQLIHYLDIDSLFAREVFRYYGSAEKIPKDENGDPYASVSSRPSYEKILYHDKRYLIDKLLLERMSDGKIADYLIDKFNVTDIKPQDIRGYRNIFFDVASVGLEEVINTLTCEKDDLIEELRRFEDSDEYDEMPLSERRAYITRAERRIEELGDSVRTLTAQHADVVYGAREANAISYEAMFADVMQRSYARFVKLDSDPRMDVIDPMFKTANLMKNAHDRIIVIQDRELKNATSDNTSKDSDEIIMQLYKRRAEEVANEELLRTNARITSSGSEFVLAEGVSPDEVEGLAELGLNIRGNEDDDN